MKFIQCVFFLVLAVNSGYAQKIATLEVELQWPAPGLFIPVSIDLDAITHEADSSLYLVEIKGKESIPVPSQISHGEKRTLHWMVEPKNVQNKKMTFELVRGMPSVKNNIQVTDREGSVTIHSGSRNLIRYNYKTVYPPEGIDTVYKRSAFIHPLWSPGGQVLTRIQPTDHYHHYGIWNPWTHVLYEGDTIDFWNLVKQQGTVRFSKFVSINEGPVFAGYKAIHEHVVFKKTGKEKVALNELQDVKIYAFQDNKDYFIADLTFNMSCADDSPFRILEYRYGGLGWRATEEWHKDNSEMLSSTGMTRKDVDGSKERWCIIQGKAGEEYAGLVMMSYPTNYNHPEPMRNWPLNANDNRGDVFANFNPTKDRDWLLEPRQNYVLKYRLLVFNGKFTREKAESAWQYYAQPPVVKVKLN